MSPDLAKRLGAAVARAYPEAPQADSFAAAKRAIERGDIYEDINGQIACTPAGARALPRIFAAPRGDNSDESRIARAMAHERAISGDLSAEEAPPFDGDPRITAALATEARLRATFGEDA